jgi:hypothetical protein
LHASLRRDRSRFLRPLQPFPHRQPCRALLEFPLEEAGQAHALSRCSAFQHTVHRLRHIANLNRLRHIDHMLACAAHVCCACAPHYPHALSQLRIRLRRLWRDYLRQTPMPAALTLTTAALEAPSPAVAAGKEAILATVRTGPYGEGHVEIAGHRPQGYRGSLQYPTG